MSFFEEIEALTLELVKTPSMNNTEGERRIAEQITAYLRSLDYFKQNPENVWESPLLNDSFGRKNVFALLRGQKGESAATILLHGHMDTVGIEDFGALGSFAFDPLLLQDKLRTCDISPEVKKDLESGDWLFGRGAVDMKSGLAAHLVVLKALSEQVESFSGNILFMANPVEENQHTGIIEALPVLKQLKEERGFDYLMAINNDYISPLYPGDKNRYVYLGAVGKLLACFYIVGKETHVGQCFEGLDPNLIGAELMKLIDLNVELCDSFEGESTLPPASLKFADRKKAYNVQTPLATFIYFNFFVHNASTNEILVTLKSKAEQAVSNIMAYLEEQYGAYCRQTGLVYTKLPFNKPRVLTFQQLYEEVKAYRGEELDSSIQKIVKELMGKKTDVRDVCLAVVELVKEQCRDINPMIVLFFAPPYCPHNTLTGATDREKLILDLVKDTASYAEQEFSEQIHIGKFFPCLSDSSYLRINDDSDSINSLVSNLPEWDSVYPVPVGLIKELNIPAINFGVYGKDAHRWTERVYKPYSFSVLPQMTKYAIEKLLDEFQHKNL